MVTNEEIITVAISPYQIARGPVVSRDTKTDCATISVGTHTVRGKCLQTHSQPSMQA